VRLFNASTVFEERWGGVTSEGWDGQFVFPRNAQAGQLVLEATELFTGRSTWLSIARSQASTTFSIHTPRFKERDVPPRVVPALALSDEPHPRIGWAPVENHFGPHIRDLTIPADGAQAVLSAFNWDTNLYGLGLATGK